MVYISTGLLDVTTAIVADTLVTAANRVQSPAGSPDFLKCESCRTMPLVGGFLWDLPFPPPNHSSAAPYLLRSPLSALNTSLLRATQVSSLSLVTATINYLARPDIAIVQSLPRESNYQEVYLMTVLRSILTIAIYYRRVKWAIVFTCKIRATVCRRHDTLRLSHTPLVHNSATVPLQQVDLVMRYVCRYWVTQSGELHVRDTAPGDSYGTYYCWAVDRLTGTRRLSSPGQIIVTGEFYTARRFSQSAQIEGQVSAVNSLPSSVFSCEECMRRFVVVVLYHAAVSLRLCSTTFSYIIHAGQIDLCANSLDIGKKAKWLTDRPARFCAYFRFGGNTRFKSEEDVVPVIEHIVSSVHVKVGNTAELICVAKGNPPPTYRYFNILTSLPPIRVQGAPSAQASSTTFTGARVTERLYCSPPTKTNQVQSLAGLLRMFVSGIVEDDVAGRWVFFGMSRFPRPFIPALLHAHLTSPASALKTAIMRNKVCVVVLVEPKKKFSNFPREFTVQGIAVISPSGTQDEAACLPKGEFTVQGIAVISPSGTQDEAACLPEDEFTVQCIAVISHSGRQDEAACLPEGEFTVQGIAVISSSGRQDEAACLPEDEFTVQGIAVISPSGTQDEAACLPEGEFTVQGIAVISPSGSQDEAACQES
ncbi:hypothetical protein PR048_033107 [Dryococelus australis]|uniref:Ig-like domain-containing protein n=1 Tax=Dryococelus australis TaxID=614101 RepID=A0ABQ9G2G4_9NEOP|nr:hypothetical protein PR048_033107 [Dryococelus australis]